MAFHPLKTDPGELQSLRALFGCFGRFPAKACSRNAPASSEGPLTALEASLPYHSSGRISGKFCIQVSRCFGGTAGFHDQSELGKPGRLLLGAQGEGCEALWEACKALIFYGRRERLPGFNTCYDRRLSPYCLKLNKHSRNKAVTTRSCAQKGGQAGQDVWLVVICLHGLPAIGSQK